MIRARSSICIWIALVPGCAAELSAAETPGVRADSAVRYNKSWIEADASQGGNPLVSGDTWRVPVEYYLDPSEHFGVTTLYAWGTGPWIDTPDGKYATRRGHVSLAGLSRSLKLTQAGRGRHEFVFIVPPGLDLVKKNNRLLLLVGFRDDSGKDWPWHVRVENTYMRQRGYFEIEFDAPGHLFTYDEPVRMAIRTKSTTADAGAARQLRYRVYNTAGAVVREGSQPFTVGSDGQRVEVELDIRQRGVFLLEANVPGWEQRHTTFARIPDLPAITGGQPTAFGMTTHWQAPPEEVWRIAQRLGLSTCRRFTRWRDLQPAPGRYRFDELARELDAARRHGVNTWLCLVEPPPFAFPERVELTSYRAFDFHQDVWREFVTAATTQLKGKFLGWEWLNEITPGGCEDPVKTYVNMCRIGAEAVQAIDPSLITILAGGLYPRSFRKEVLAAGGGQYVDVLPVHYQNGDGVLEARQDLDAAALPQLAVWEDESAKGFNAWAVPPLEELQNTSQCDWVLRQWTDELAAGCGKIVYFGGVGSAAGSHDYLLDDLSPRPVAATLAVFASKMHGSSPLGVFLLGKGGLCHLFQREGKALLVASTYEQAGETVALRLGGDELVLTDYQGNESRLAAPGGVATLPLGPLPFFVEGGDLDLLKAYVTPRIEAAAVGAGTSAGVALARRAVPRVAALRGQGALLNVSLVNAHDRRLSGVIRVAPTPGWPHAAPIPFSLEAGQRSAQGVAVEVPAECEPRDYLVQLEFDFDWDKLPTIEKPVVLSVISPDMLGNLIPNGDFETAAANGQGPADWSTNGVTKIWAEASGLGAGLGQRVLTFQRSDGWEYVSRTIPVRGGQTYLYTFWVRNEQMGLGSNMTLHLADGRRISLYDSQVMRCGDNNPYWQVFTCRKATPPEAEQVSFTPVARGPGWAMIDNVRVTLFEGSDDVAERHQANRPVHIDGRLDDWITACPIPLMGRNQLAVAADDYAWTPDNLSGVGHVMWDQANLYVAIRVRDDVHYAVAVNDDADLARGGPAGDGLILAIDPSRQSPRAGAAAVAYYISSARPGGGSGAHTLLRPRPYSGGRTAGHLFRDSSVYDLAVAAQGGHCIYELRIPFAELGIAGGLGVKMGLSLQLNDSDGQDTPGRMNWGRGLPPRWSPEQFGVLTLVP